VPPGKNNIAMPVEAINKKQLNVKSLNSKGIFLMGKLFL
jgi:hypothetical protein